VYIICPLLFWIGWPKGADGSPNYNQLLLKSDHPPDRFRNWFLFTGVEARKMEIRPGPRSIAPNPRANMHVTGAVAALHGPTSKNASSGPPTHQRAWKNTARPQGFGEVDPTNQTHLRVLRPPAMNVSEEGAGALEFSNLLRALHRRAHVAARLARDIPLRLQVVWVLLIFLLTCSPQFQRLVQATRVCTVYTFSTLAPPPSSPIEHLLILVYVPLPSLTCPWS